MFADCHVHSNMSIDAVDDIDTVCRAAIERGLPRLCFTNHYELFAGNAVPETFLFDYDHYSEKIERARDKFGAHLEILKGVEFGQPHRHPKEFDQLQKRGFDMITASVHVLPMEFAIHWLWLDGSEIKGEILPYLQELYYKEMIAMTAFGGFDVVAHFDWPKRIYPGFTMDAGVCGEVFANLKKNDAVLEINTAAIDAGCDWFYPNPAILQAYYESGLFRVVIGSDAHIGTDVGNHFDRVAAYLQGLPLVSGFFKDRRFRSNIGAELAAKERTAMDFNHILEDELWLNSSDTPREPIKSK